MNAHRAAAEAAAASATAAATLTLEQWWKVCVAIGPSVAVAYELTTHLFLFTFGEPAWNETSRFCPGIAVRLALLVACSAMDWNLILGMTTAEGSMVTSMTAIMIVIISVSCSLYFIYQTRCFIRGPIPLLGSTTARVDVSNNGNSNSTEIINRCMANKVVLITGANTGIGKETARQLAELGAIVILACRSRARALQAMDDIQQQLKRQSRNNPTEAADANLHFLELDLSSFESVKKAAKTFATMDLTPGQHNDTTDNKTNITNNRINKLDVLINNAGVMFSEKAMSKDGLEMCLQANHLGHFLLTLLLLPHMLPDPQPISKPNQPTSTSESLSTSSPLLHPQSMQSKPRILNLSSITYKMALAKGAGFEFEDYNCNDRPYSLFTTYSQSKLANILFTKELARRYPDTLLALAINPGLVRTDVTRNMSPILRFPNYVFGFLVQLYQKVPREGAYSSVWAATEPFPDQEDGPESDAPTTETTKGTINGSFVYNSRLEPTLDYCHNEEAAKKLWEWSENLVQWNSKNT